MTQRLPHQAVATHVTPVTRRPQAAAPQPPVFIDQSGWRRRTLQGVALAVGLACLGYLLFVGVLVSGLRQPVGTHPPSTTSTNRPARSGPDTGKSSHGSGTPVRAEAHRPSVEAHAARENHYSRPLSGRSAPPSAGGPEQ
ncbi:hypothetical protein ACIBCO_37440 [Streptomyces violascens]|uniref:hypothetical protein n=1 Tax=Streptomyces violascens TaxID=67381 RepID=UPI0037A66A62